MFEDYHLIHFDAASPMLPENAGQFAVSARSPGAMRSNYRITGSLDYLAPFIQKTMPDEFVGSELFLQSFCVMDNTPGYFTSRTDYDSLLLSYTYNGEGLLTYHGKSHTIEAGSGFVIDCREAHEYRCSGAHWQHVDVHLWGGQAEALGRCFQRLGICTFSFPATAMNRLLEDVLDAYTTPSRLRNLHVGNALSHMLCTVLKRAEENTAAGIPPTYQSMVRYMENNYTQPLPLDALAERFHVSKYHMSREFRRYTGYSPGEYLIALRVQHALILLAQSDLSVEEVALQSGFGNMSNFIGQIKKRTGMTPSEFRTQQLVGITVC